MVIKFLVAYVLFKVVCDKLSIIKHKKEINLKLIEDLGQEYATEKSKRKDKFGIYECSKCGNHFRSRTANIKNGTTKSCGCILKEKTSKRLKEQNFKHGYSKTRLYSIWKDMNKRCRHHKDYKGRGINVCKNWEDNFLNFRQWSLENGYKDNLSIDRIDNDGNYEPSNCRWTDKFTQAQNKRPLSIKNTSGYKGAFFKQRSDRYKKRNVWECNIVVNNKQIYIGIYDTAKQCGQAYNDYVIEHKLEHSLNEIKE